MLSGLTDGPRRPGMQGGPRGGPWRLRLGERDGITTESVTTPATFAGPTDRVVRRHRSRRKRARQERRS